MNFKKINELLKYDQCYNSDDDVKKNEIFLKLNMCEKFIYHDMYLSIHYFKVFRIEYDINDMEEEVVYLNKDIMDFISQHEDFFNSLYSHIIIINNHCNVDKIYHCNSLKKNFNGIIVFSVILRGLFNINSEGCCEGMESGMLHRDYINNNMMESVNILSELRYIEKNVFIKKI